MKLKDKLIISIAVIVIGLALYLWISPDNFRKVPDITLTSLDNEKIKLTSLHGKPVLIVFWATSCTGCVKEMPHLVELYNKLHDKGLEMIGIAMPYDRPDHVISMVKQKQLPYKIALDISGTAVKAFGNVQLTPTSFLISPSGDIAMQKIGEMNMALVERQIIAFLNTQ